MKLDLTDLEVMDVQTALDSQLKYLNDTEERNPGEFDEWKSALRRLIKKIKKQTGVIPSP